MVKLSFEYLLGIFALVFLISCASGEGWHRIDGGSFNQSWLEGNKAQCDAEAGKILKGLGATADPQTVANMSGPLVASFLSCMEQKGWSDD